MREEKEEFEFKPITDGLGFHKKTMDLKEDLGLMPAPRMQTQTVVQEPLIRKPAPQAEVQKPWNPALKDLTIEDKPAAPVVLEECPVAWSAGAFDAIMVGGLSLIFAALVLALTRVDILNLSETLMNERGAVAALIVLVTGVYEIYVITCRSFFARTLGEWTFGFRVGSVKEQEELLYPIRVAWRSFLIAFSGFIILPAISAAIGRDVPGILSGARLYSENK